MSINQKRIKSNPKIVRPKLKKWLRLSFLLVPLAAFFSAEALAQEPEYDRAYGACLSGRGYTVK